MSLLPQRKKSAEEIARLRESLGIPAGLQEPGADEVIDKILPATHAAKLEHPPETTRIAPPAENAPHEARPVHSLKRSERVPVEPVPEPVPTAESTVESAAPAAQTPKRVRSLRKSEQVPIPPPQNPHAGPESPVPFHRHSDQELAEIRRREALALLQAPAPQKISPAHPALLVPGYLASVIGTAGFNFYEFHPAVIGSCVGLALLVASVVFMRNPYSRHHAAFITVMAVLVAVFGTLHYFPQLSFHHGS